MLKVVELHVYRDSVHVLRGISLEVDEDEVVLIGGRNGAGKTTILKTVLGLIPKKSGKVTFGNEEISGLPSHQVVKRKIAYSPEAFAVFDDLTVEENIEMGAKVLGHSADTDRMDSILEIFHELRPLRRRKAMYLSGGERKMVGIARALYTSPSLLLLDEPLEGLAPVAIGRFLEGMEKIKAAGISMMIAESSYYCANRAITSKLVDRLYCVERGEIAYEGEPAGIFQNEHVLRMMRGY